MGRYGLGLIHIPVFGTLQCSGFLWPLERSIPVPVQAKPAVLPVCLEIPVRDMQGRMNAANAGCVRAAFGSPDAPNCPVILTGKKTG